MIKSKAIGDDGVFQFIVTHYSTATNRIKANDIPDWLQDALGPERLKELADSFDLSFEIVPELLGVPLSLHLAYGVKRLSTREIKDEVNELVGVIDRLDHLLTNLSPETDLAVVPEWEAFNADIGEPEIQYDPEHIANFQHVVRSFRDNIDVSKAGRTQKGRPKSDEYKALTCLLVTLSRCKSNLSVKNFIELATKLLEPVQQYHARQSKAPNLEAHELPRLTDTARRAFADFNAGKN